jgi:transposase
LIGPGSGVRVPIALKPVNFRKGASGLAALEDGRFRWPKIEDGSNRLTPAQLGALIEGLDWMRVHAEDMAPEKYGRSTRPSVMIHDRLESKYALIPSRV